MPGCVGARRGAALAAVSVLSGDVLIVGEITLVPRAQKKIIRVVEGFCFVAHSALPELHLSSRSAGLGNVNEVCAWRRGRWLLLGWGGGGGVDRDARTDLSWWWRSHWRWSSPLMLLVGRGWRSSKPPPPDPRPNALPTPLHSQHHDSFMPRTSVSSCGTPRADVYSCSSCDSAASWCARVVWVGRVGWAGSGAERLVRVAESESEGGRRRSKRWSSWFRLCVSHAWWMAMSSSGSSVLFDHAAQASHERRTRGRRKGMFRGLTTQTRGAEDVGTQRW